MKFLFCSEHSLTTLPQRQGLLIKKIIFIGGSSVFSFKIYNKFYEETSNVNILNENQNHIYFDDCCFDNQEESIFFFTEISI